MGRGKFQIICTDPRPFPESEVSSRTFLCRQLLKVEAPWVLGWLVTNRVSIHGMQGCMNQQGPNASLRVSSWAAGFTTVLSIWNCAGNVCLCIGAAFVFLMAKQTIDVKQPRPIPNFYTRAVLLVPPAMQILTGNQLPALLVGMLFSRIRAIHKFRML